MGIIDSSSRWPEIHLIRSTTSETIANCLEKTFTTHGYPLNIVTDNAPNLTSAEIDDYCDIYGIDHHKALPYWPQGNSEIERFYRTLGKFIKTAHTERRNWKKEIYKFLLTYRNTPHCTTNVAPSVLLMNRKLRDKIPTATETSDTWEKAEKFNMSNKLKSKVYYNSRRHVKLPTISVGDFVLLKQQKKENKLSTPFIPTPLQVIEVSGPAITVQDGDTTVTRNVAHVKKIPHYEVPCSDVDRDNPAANKDYNPRRSLRNRQ